MLWTLLFTFCKWFTCTVSNPHFFKCISGINVSTAKVNKVNDELWLGESIFITGICSNSLNIWINTWRLKQFLPKLIFHLKQYITKYWIFTNYWILTYLSPFACCSLINVFLVIKQNAIPRYHSFLPLIV